MIFLQKYHNFFVIIINPIFHHTVHTTFYNPLFPPHTHSTMTTNQFSTTYQNLKNKKYHISNSKSKTQTERGFQEKKQRERKTRRRRWRGRRSWRSGARGGWGRGWEAWWAGSSCSTEGSFSTTDLLRLHSRLSSSLLPTTCGFCFYCSDFIRLMRKIYFVF